LKKSDDLKVYRAENFDWEFLFGKSTFHYSQVPFLGAMGGLVTEKTAKGIELVIKMRNLYMEHKFPLESFHWENRTTFSGIPFILDHFQWNEPKS